MKKLRGFKLGRKVVRVFKWITHPRRKSNRLTRSFNPISKIFSLTRFLECKTKKLRFNYSDSGYIQLGREKKPTGVPKGHLAVYVGKSDSETRREVVPVIYFNHPLFGDLLKEAERVYGYNHSGGIMIPCGYSEFEKIKMRIAAWDNCRQQKKIRWKHHHHQQS